MSINTPIKLQVLGIVAMLSTGCFSVEIGFRERLISFVEQDQHLDPEHCEEVGSNTTTCTRPGQSTIAYTFSRDEAAIAEALVVSCTGKDCPILYRVTCDLAGCVKHLPTDPPDSWTLR